MMWLLATERMRRGSRTPVVAVEVVDEGGEDGHVGHLPADHPRLDLAGPEEPAHLLDQVALDLGDEVGALVVVDIGVQERPHSLVLGIAKRGVHDRERTHQRRLGHLRGDEVDAPTLAPAAVLERQGHQVGGPGGLLGDRRDLFRPRSGQGAEGDRTAEGRCIRADQPGRHPGPDAVAADVHLDLGVIVDVDVQEGHPDGAPLAPLSEDAREAIAGEDPVGCHGAAGHVSDEAVARVDLGALPCHAAVEELEGLDDPGQDVPIDEVAVPHPAVRGFLAGQRLPADELALQGALAHPEARRRAGVDGDRPALRVDAQLVAVEGEGRLQAQGVACPQADGGGAQAHEPVPDLAARAGRHEQLEAERFAGVPGPGDDQLQVAELRRTEVVPTGLGQVRAGDELADDAARTGPLDGGHGDVAGAIVQGEAREPGREAEEVRPVRLAVRRIHDEEVVITSQAVEVGVVDGPTVCVRDQRVLRAAGGKGRGVAGQDVLQEGQGPRPAHGEAAHVRDVEETGVPARLQVLPDDARGVLDGHLPAAEVDHVGARLDVLLVEWRPLHRSILPGGNPRRITCRPGCGYGHAARRTRRSCGGIDDAATRTLPAPVTVPTTLGEARWAPRQPPDREPGLLPVVLVSPGEGRTGRQSDMMVR